jgi:DMSO/TMAO reductase YedYZ molybdopterin-dependent catalytic subunit
MALRVGGVDDHAQPSRRDHSRPGAAWVFERAQLARSGAFLATAMEGAPLAPDHGAPVRLVVPGWYGCAHVKWVDAIDWVGADEPATSQMREFARRTHQRGVPALAREYYPATIDAAALPVRVERWRVRGETLLRIVGLVWGGDGSERALRIRVGPSGAWQPVALDDALRGHGWQLWQHAWRPAHGGRHTIHCRFDDAASQRRQRAGFHDRAIVL